MKSIILTSKTYGIHEMFYDDEDHELVLSRHWMILKSKSHYYAYAQKKTRSECGKRIVKTYLFHRECLRATSQHVDHINGHTMNNCKSNLRQCTAQQNCQNRAMAYNNPIGYKGVSWIKKRAKYRSRLCIKGKDVFCKFFDNPVDAAKAYNEAALKYFGNFARLNII